jgi:hypothetical protein
MLIASLLLALAATSIDVDVATLPLTGEIKLAFAPAGRSEMKRDGNVSQIKIDIDRINPPRTLDPASNTYVVWAISGEGIFDNLGELQMNGNKAQFNGTTRFGQFGILITAEPHYMVDRPSSAVAYRLQTPRSDVRRKTVSIEVGSYDYSGLVPTTAVGVQGWVVQARAAFQIAKAAGADRLAPEEFRNAQVAIGSLEELITRAAPADIMWPTANEAIGWSQRAAMAARGKK